MRMSDWSSDVCSSDLEGLFDRIIEAPKIPRIYQRALRLVGDASTAFMVGDQLQRDIRPAKEAGLRTIYFPGGFRPHWELKEQSVQPDFRVHRFDPLPAIVAGETASPAGCQAGNRDRTSK